MTDLNSYIESGILERYLLGAASAAEEREVEEMAARYPRIATELNDISKALETYAVLHGKAPDVTIKPAILSIMDFMERISNGEAPSFPPLLHQASKIVDYAEWLNREDMVLPADFVDFYGKIIGHNDVATTLITWIKDGSPVEVHDDELESFLVIEGTCTITIENEEYNLVAGDVLSIPLYKKHFVKVTSPFACKVILQRVAA